MNIFETLKLISTALVGNVYNIVSNCNSQLGKVYILLLILEIKRQKNPSLAVSPSYSM